MHLVSLAPQFSSKLTIPFYILQFSSLGWTFSLKLHLFSISIGHDLRWLLRHGKFLLPGNFVAILDYIPHGRALQNLAHHNPVDWTKWKVSRGIPYQAGCNHSKHHGMLKFVIGIVHSIQVFLTHLRFHWNHPSPPKEIDSVYASYATNSMILASFTLLGCHKTSWTSTSPSLDHISQC